MTRSDVRQLIVILGDQLDHGSAVFDGFDPRQDLIWMAEVTDESARLQVTLPRITIFLAAMRHFRDELLALGHPLEYVELTEDYATLSQALKAAVVRHRPQRVVVVEPGEWHIKQALRAAVAECAVDYDEREDRHFLCSHAEFARHCAGRKQLRMEYFYREMRRRYRILLDENAQPEGGDWNYDSDNRKTFGKAGPAGLLSRPIASFEPDRLTLEVIALVRKRFASHAGQLDAFDWPVTRADARLALQDFIDHRLAAFGDYQDAMWTHEPWLFHSRISAALNLKLLNPREVITAVEQAFRAGRVPLASAEGFIRQILGWREYVRGIYWRLMPGYLHQNALGAAEPLPDFFWTGRTDLHCLHQAIDQTLKLGYAHHIQRLMVTGLFCLLLGVEPQAVHRWYLAVYVDAVEWVELPNTLGMSQYADGGVLASKPYVASGKYLARMSNYCVSCRYDPAESVGPKACPFTTLYWDFLLRHETKLAGNSRMALQLRNLGKLTATQRERIVQQAEAFRASLRPGGRSNLSS
jgi:deoxyribodipyrimidine photolyase-related protein